MSYESESQALDAEVLGVIERWHQTGEPLQDCEFNDLALRLFAYQCSHNQPYRRYCERLSVTSPSSWDEIPAVPAAAFKEAALTTFDARRAALVFETSGTTRGTPGRHYMESALLYDAALLAAFDRFVLKDDARLRYFNLVPNPSEDPHSSLGYMMARVGALRGNGSSRWYVRGGELLVEELIADLSVARTESRPVCVAATAFALVHLLDAMALRECRIALPQGSRIITTGGFKGRARAVDRGDLDASIRDRFAVTSEAIIPEYGMTELTSQYYATGDRPYRGPPWLRTRIVSPERTTLLNGTVGALLHVDLANRSSCIALQTEDLGTMTDDGLLLLGRAREASPRGCSLDAEQLRAHAG